jgi:hypothetical protein
MPVWLLIQAGEEKYNDIGENLRKAFFDARGEMPQNGPVALLIDSPGGDARNAFQIATLFRRQCSGFTAVVPRYAKSAATLLVLGAKEIILNRFAELGPLDAQVWDSEREEFSSALDEVQTLERLHAFSLEALDRTMMFLIGRTGKKVERMLPQVAKYIADIMSPMLAHVDVVHFTQRARLLKVAEEYAIRLLRSRHSNEEAQTIARHLVEKYPEHDFVIDADELAAIGIKNTKQPTADQINLMDGMIPYLGKTSFIGRVEGVPNP